MPPSAYESDQKPQSKGFFSSLLGKPRFRGGADSGAADQSRERR
jgi:hypothetical protein